MIHNHQCVGTIMCQCIMHKAIIHARRFPTKPTFSSVLLYVTCNVQFLPFNFEPAQQTSAPPKAITQQASDWLHQFNTEIAALHGADFFAEVQGLLQQKTGATRCLLAVQCADLPGYIQPCPTSDGHLPPVLEFNHSLRQQLLLSGHMIWDQESLPHQLMQHEQWCFALALKGDKNNLLKAQWEHKTDNIIVKNIARRRVADIKKRE